MLSKKNIYMKCKKGENIAIISITTMSVQKSKFSKRNLERVR